MGNALDEAAARLSAAADDIAALDAGEQAADFLNQLAAALTSLSQAVSAAASAFRGSLAEDAQDAEPSAPVEPEAPAEPQA